MKVSVLIPTNLNARMGWLKHRINFLYSLGYQFETIVGVWNGHEHIPSLASFASGLSSKIKIIPLKADDRFTLRAIQMAEAASGAYVVMQGDDDFILPAALNEPIRLLGENPDICAAQGRIIGFDPNLNAPYFVSPYPMNEANDPILMSRYRGYFGCFSTTFHGVYRKPQFIERLQLMDDVAVKTTNGAFFEHIGEFYTVITGRFVLTDEVFFIKGRHEQAESVILKASLNDKMAPYLIGAATFSADYAVLEKTVFSLLEKAGADLSDINVLKEAKDGILDYLGWVMFKRRTEWPVKEQALRDTLRQKPSPDIVSRVFGLVDATRVDKGH